MRPRPVRVNRALRDGDELRLLGGTRVVHVPGHTPGSIAFHLRSARSAVVGDALPGVRVVKAFANERKEVARFDRRSDEYTVHEQEVNQVWAMLQPVR